MSNCVVLMIRLLICITIICNGMADVRSENNSYPYCVIKPSRLESDLDEEYLCETISPCGGWVIIQRRTTGNTDFNRGWDDYKNGFGPLHDDFWLGNDNIHTITSRGLWDLRVDLRYSGDAAFAIYRNFSVADEQDKYRLRLGSFYTGTLPDSLSHHNNMQFTTFDMDNDKGETINCAASEMGRGGWWYDYCDDVDLNGVWGARADYGVEWRGFSSDQSYMDDEEPVDFTEMKIRRVL